MQACELSCPCDRWCVYVCAPPGSVLLRIGLGSTAPGSEDWTGDLRRLDELIPYELRVSDRRAL
jgi:hypothetical protein